MRQVAEMKLSRTYRSAGRTDGRLKDQHAGRMVISRDISGRQRVESRLLHFCLPEHLAENIELCPDDNDPRHWQ
jgi:hypothetical protein